MGFFDNIKQIIADDDYDDFDDNFYDDVEEPIEKPKANRKHFSMPEIEREEKPKKRHEKVVNINTTARLSVQLFAPERFEEATRVADSLCSKITVVLNLENTNRDVARRLLDFLSGVAYANNGQLKRIANSTYLLTPYDVDFSGDLIDDLENSGMI